MDEKELETVMTEEVTEETIEQEAAETAGEPVETAEEVTGEAVEEAAEDMAEEAAEEIAEAAGETDKKKKCRRGLFIKQNSLEWMSTLALAVAILFAGYLLGLATQAGYTGLAMAKAAFSDWYNLLHMAMLVAMAVLCSTVCKKHSAGWLAIPAGVYTVMTCLAMYRPIVIGYALLLTYSKNPGDASALMLLQQMLVPLCLVLGTYLFQLLVTVSFMLLVNGKGNRWVHLALCLVWLVGNVFSNFPNLNTTFNENAPLLMLNLSFVAIAALYAMPAICGKKVSVCQLAELRAADAAAKGNTAPESIGVIADAEACAVEASEAAEACTEEAPEIDGEYCEACGECGEESCEDRSEAPVEAAEAPAAEAAEEVAESSEEN